MNTYQLRQLVVVIAAGLAVFAPSLSSAVQLSLDGTGEALLYPYYSVNASPGGGQFDTYISIVNTTTRGKAVKVRFLEGKNGREVMDFNLYLSANDTWAGAIVQGSPGAKVITFDKSCIQPVTYKGKAIDFYAKNYTGVNADGGDQTLNRTREGWIEVYEMGEVSTAALQAAIKPDQNGEPPLCNAFDAAIPSNFSPPTGGLMGQVNIIDVKLGASYNYDAVALDAVFGAAMWTREGASPTFADAKPVSTVISSSTYKARDSRWVFGYQAVTAVLQAASFLANYNADTNVRATSDVVMVMPTKRFHTAPGAILSPFSADGCDPVIVKNYNREGQEATSATALCNSLNVVSYGPNGKIFGSQYSSVWAVPFENGLSTLTALQAHVSMDAPSNAHQGLPLMGVQMANFNNGTLVDAFGKSLTANYGFNFVARRKVVVTP